MRLQLQSPHQDSLPWNLLLPCPLLDLHRRPPQTMRTLTNSTCLTNPARTTIQLRKKKKQPNPINPQDNGYISDFWGVCYPNKSPKWSEVTPSASCTRTKHTWSILFEVLEHLICWAVCHQRLYFWTEQLWCILPSQLQPNLHALLSGNSWQHIWVK